MACEVAQCNKYKRDMSNSLRRALKNFSDECGTCQGSGLQDGSPCGTCNGGGIDGGSGCDPNVGCGSCGGGSPGTGGGALPKMGADEIASVNSNIG